MTAAEDRLARIAYLLAECPPPDMAAGSGRCAHGPWPCVITQAVWLAQGCDRGQVRAAYQAAEREERLPHWEAEAAAGAG